MMAAPVAPSPEGEAVRWDMAGKDEHTIEQAAGPERQHKRVQNPITSPVRTQASQKQAGSQQPEAHHPGVAARVLREPDMVITESEQRRRNQRFPLGGHRAADVVQGTHSSDAEQHGRKPNRPGTFAEQR